jgi:hypothetical protein
MAVGSTPATAYDRDAPISGKEIDLTGSASNSDIDFHSSNKSKERTTFATKGLRQDHYRPIDSYEGIHRYDPEFDWEPEEERKVVRKVRLLCSSV